MTGNMSVVETNTKTEFIQKNRPLIKTSLHSLTWYSKQQESTCLATEKKLTHLSSSKVKKSRLRKTHLILRYPFQIDFKSNTACVTIFVMSKCHLSMIFKVQFVIFSIGDLYLIKLTHVLLLYRVSHRLVPTFDFNSWFFWWSYQKS